MPVRSTLLTTLAAAVLLTSCNSGSSHRTCTAIFAMISVSVVDQQGNPVTGMTITDSVLRTHATFTVPQIEGIYPPGTHQVFSDNFSDQVRESGDPVRVVGTNGTISFSADFVFGVPGGCHVGKLAGPDSVVAR